VANKVRLDVLLVERGLAPTREKAQALIMAGQVRLDGAAADKAGRQVSREAKVEVIAGLPYVSRGGLKLAHALDSFSISVAGLVALDVGASTGGFTDCLLQRGAARVYALDVGYGQLDYKLRTDPHVVVMDRVNAHYPFELPEKADMATVDVSFISVLKVLPNVIPHVRLGGSLLVLVKPQFEAERGQVGKGGIVKDPRVHAQVLTKVLLWAIDGRLGLRGLVPSPILGTEGNREFLLWLRLPATP